MTSLESVAETLNRSPAQQQAFQRFKNVLLRPSEFDGQASELFRRLLRSHHYTIGTINGYQKIFALLLAEQNLFSLRAFLSTYKNHGLAIRAFKFRCSRIIHGSQTFKKMEPWRVRTLNTLFAKIATVYFFDNLELVRQQIKRKKPTSLRSRHASWHQPLSPPKLESSSLPPALLPSKQEPAQSPVDTEARALVPPDLFTSSFDLHAYLVEEPLAESLFNIDRACVTLNSLFV